MSGAGLMPCRLTTSLSRDSARAATGTRRAAESASAARRNDPTRIETITFTPSENLVEHPDEEARLQAVLDQALAERLDPELADRRRQHDVARLDIHRTDDAREDDEAPVAVDVDLAYAF